MTQSAFQTCLVTTQGFEKSLDQIAVRVIR